MAGIRNLPCSLRQSGFRCQRQPAIGLSGHVPAQFVEPGRGLRIARGAPVAPGRQRAARTDLGAVGQGGSLELALLEETMEKDFQPAPYGGKVVYGTMVPALSAPSRYISTLCRLKPLVVDVHSYPMKAVKLPGSLYFSAASRATSQPLRNSTEPGMIAISIGNVPAVKEAMISEAA